MQCLARSLCAAAARFPLLVLCTPDTLSSTTLQALRLEGCTPVPVQRYVPAGAPVGCSGSVLALQTGSGRLLLHSQLANVSILQLRFSQRCEPDLALHLPWCTALCCACCVAGRQDYGLYKQPAYAECWTKLRMWQMEEYDRRAALGTCRQPAAAGAALPQI